MYFQSSARCLVSALRKLNHLSLKIFFLILFIIAADAYSHTDSEFLKSENSQNRDAGSTASTAILVGDRLLVANVGDSRAVICRGGEGKCSINMFHHSYYLWDIRLSVAYTAYKPPLEIRLQCVWMRVRESRESKGSIFMNLDIKLGKGRE